MTDEFEYLMRLVSAGASGVVAPSPKQDVDWHSVMRLAQEQNVLPLVAYALRNSPEISCSDIIKNDAAKMLRSTAISNSLRRLAILHLLEEMDRVGIHAVVVKGFVVAEMYTAPECRVSVDTDIWVDPKDEQRACDFLSTKGFSVEPRWKKSHHAVCYHPQMGCLELHVILYDEIVEEVWFGRMDGREFVREPHVKIHTEDGCYYTLGDTDHLVFLALHMVKHFILSGTSLRMMMDVGLYFKGKHEQVNMQRFWDTINSLNYGELINAIFGAMVDYCQFAEDDFPGIGHRDNEIIQMLLNDLEAGGWMGYKNREAREDGWYEYNRQMLLKENKHWQYKLYMLKWQSGLYVKLLFPAKKQLAERYPCILKRPWLIPYAWVHRLLFRGVKYIGSDKATKRIVTGEDQLSQSGKERITLFKRLGMM